MARTKLKHNTDNSGVWDGLRLSAMEKAFIIEWTKPEYFLNKNKTEGKYKAFEAAGYNIRYTTSGAGNQIIHASTRATMSEVTGKKDFQEGLLRWREHIMGEAKEQIKATVVDVLIKRATYDPGMFVNKDGEPTFKTIEDIPEEWRCVIDHIEKKGFGKDSIMVTNVKLANRNEALKQLASFTSMIKTSDLQVAARITNQNHKSDAKDSSPTVEFIFNKSY